MIHVRLRTALGVAVLAMIAFGCDAPPDASQSVAPSAAPIAEADCRIEQPPGPDDGPPVGGGEMDTSDDGAGRWRICLASPPGVTAEGSAWCRWDAARARVDEIAGLPVSAGSVDLDAAISFPSSGFEVHLTDRAQGGVIANYGPRFDLPEIDTDAAHLRGVAPVDVVLLVGEDAPAGAPAGLTGWLVWECGDPPLA